MSTYGELQTQIGNWLARDDLTADLPTIVRAVESEVARTVRHREMEMGTTLNVTGPSLTLPTANLKIRSINLGVIQTQPELTQLSPAGLRGSEFFARAGNPAFFAIEGCAVIFAPSPTPTAPVDIFLTYFAREAAFTQASDTNELLQNHFDLYLYCGLKHAARFVQDFDSATQYDQEFGRIQEEVNRQENRARMANNALIVQRRQIT